jgi:hypothetical protein
LCSHFDLLTDLRWLQLAGNTPKKWVGAITARFTASAPD